MNPQNELPTSDHFELIALAPGIFAAISADQAAAISNAGLIDLGDRTLIFDTFLTPQAATDLKSMALEITGRHPELVINSHYHNDHIWGNQVFTPAALILSSNETRKLITTEGKEEYDYYSTHAGSRLKTLQLKLEEIGSIEEEETLAMWLGYYSGLVEALPSLEVRLPDMTFPDSFTIYGSSRRVELYTYEGGHTGSDTVLYLPEERIIFSSDLLFINNHPYLAEGDPSKLTRILEKIDELPAMKIVPGHGPIGTKEDLKLLIRYVKDCSELAKRTIKEGDQIEDVIEDIRVPVLYENWKHPSFFQSNLRFLFELFSG